MNKPSAPAVEDMELLYQEWADSEAHLHEGDEYGHEPAAFYAGFAAARLAVATGIVIAALTGAAATEGPGPLERPGLIPSSVGPATSPRGTFLRKAD